MATGSGVLRELNDLRAPMSSVLDHFVKEQKKLAKYRARYGDISSDESSDSEDAHQGRQRVTEITDDGDEGSDTAGE
jgi:hypothetical protein